YHPSLLIIKIYIEQSGTISTNLQKDITCGFTLHETQMTMKPLLLSVLLAFCINGNTQEKWDSTHRPNNFALKWAQFRSYPNSSNDIIFLGNSITAGTDWVELLGNTHARNRGISGDNSFGILERIGEVVEGKPAKIFILIGINDIARNFPDSVIVANYKRMIDIIKIQSPSTKIYFQTLLPVNDEFPAKSHFNKDGHINVVNEMLRQLCKKENVTLIELNQFFRDEN